MNHANENWPSEFELKHYSGGMSFRGEVGYSCWIGLPRSKGRLVPRGVRMWILHVEYESSEPPVGRDFLFETKEAALLKALEFYRGAGLNTFTKCRYIEGLSGERMDQTEIEEWCRKQPKALR